MQIKEYQTKDLQLKCVDLLAKTYLELGQKSDSETMITLSQIFADDLQTDFQDLTMDDIIHAFKQGVRNTDDFHLTVKTYYKWIKAHRQIIWNNIETSADQMDKRLKYRSRNGTGLKKISINKTLIS
tara:strand:- start:2743 stop:3123 length:381 start_codon:yes stop_codon:yes gene_type:complete